MDNQKDTNKDFHADKGQISNSLSVNVLFNKDDYFTPVLKRTSNITKGLYMITDIVSDNEPLKNKLRTLGIDLLSMVKYLAITTPALKHSLYTEINHTIGEIALDLDLAGTVGILGAMNSGILIKEYTRLAGTLQSQQRQNEVMGYTGGFFEDRTTSTFSLPNTLFQDDEPQKEINNAHNDKGHYKGHNSNVLYKMSDRIKDIKKNQPSSKRIGKSDIALKINRRNNIVKLIKDKNEVTIKELVSLVPDCSEKTIQRELMSLITEGVLKKTGEKRWSRYSLKTND